MYQNISLLLPVCSNITFRLFGSTCLKLDKSMIFEVAMSNGYNRENDTFAEGYGKISDRTKRAMERVSAENHAAGTMVGYYDKALTVLADCNAAEVESHPQRGNLVCHRRGQPCAGVAVQDG